MTVTITIHEHYSELYGVRTADVPAPSVGESVRQYLQRAAIGREEDVLTVVSGKAKALDYRFEKGDRVVIYPLAASG